MVDDFEARAVLAAGELRIVDGRQVHEDVEGQGRVVAAVRQHGEKCVARDDGREIAATFVGFDDSVAEPALELREDRHALSTSAPDRRSCPAAS
jgi:hypothetical protein